MNNIFIFILEFLNFYYQVYLDYQLLILFLKILVLHAFFHVLIFDLNSSRDWVFLYLVFRFAQRNRALYLTVSDRFPIFCKNFRKIFGVVCVAAKLKKWINYEKKNYDGATPYTTLYTSVIKTCKFLWWIAISFCSLSICWKYLVSSLYVSSDTLL